MDIDKILIIGAKGQIGSVLTKELQLLYGKENVVASDLREDVNFDGVFEIIDATDVDRIKLIVQQYKITQIYHLAAILSAKGEENPLLTWDINMKTMFNVFEVARKNDVSKVFYPSSIAVFGDAAPADATPQNSYLNPSTVYGISKSAGENWSEYYFNRYDLDIRSIRYPGIIGYQSLPGGGTTDYAVDIYHKAVKGEDFSCFLKEDTMLPMIFMEDAIRATIELMQAPKENIKTRTSYNLAGMSFSPEEIATAIQKILPNFKVSYNPDFRQEIANNWPRSIDDSEARIDWNWEPKYDLNSMTSVMLEKLQEQYNTFAN
ncbi:NAD-dependent epimerase/dehydratase family protein [Urechidicola sp. KH5]